MLGATDGFLEGKLLVAIKLDAGFVLSVVWTLGLVISEVMALPEEIVNNS